MRWPRPRRTVQRRSGAVSRKVGLARVDGASMRPTLESGDLVLVLYGSRARPGRLAVVRLPGGRPWGVKRLVDHDGYGWWVESDDPAAGTDSRVFGRLPDEAVLAVVLARVWPARWVAAVRGRARHSRHG